MSGDKPIVLLRGKHLPPSLVVRIEAQFNSVRLWETGDEEAWLATHGAKVAALVTSGNPLMAVPATLLDRLPNLQVICSNGVGYDAIDVQSAEARGVQVSNTPDVLNDCVADLGMALLLNIARQIPQADRYTRAGEWQRKGRFVPTTKVGGKVCGIVGPGNIGQALAKRAEAFGMEIHYYSRAPKPALNWTCHDSLLSLASAADFLVLTLPGGARTHHIVNADVLAALGPQGYLINVARGTVVDEQALISALQNGIIAGAGLDVFEHEPAVPQALLALENVVVTPHIASSTVETMQAMMDLVLANLTAWSEGKPLLTRVV